MLVRFVFVGMLLLAQFLMAEIAHISSSDVDRLAAGFASSSPIEDLSLISDTQWMCSLFGVRTRLQRSENLGLFNFQKQSPNIVLNRGSHIFEKYQLQSGRGLVSYHPTRGLLEEVRKLGPGAITSRISHLDLAGRPDQTLAFSTCLLKATPRL